MSQTDLAAAAAAGPGRRLVRKLRSARAGMVAGVAILALIVLAAVLAPFITAYEPNHQDILNRRIPPIWHGWFYDDVRATLQHPLGTDNLGRDYWSRLVYGARISLIVGFVGALLSGVIGATIGVLGGYFGGRVDLAANFLIQTRLALPVMLIALAVVASYGGSLQLIVIITGLLLWDRAAVVSRAATQQIVRREYIDSARVLGFSDAHIIFREILPNLRAPLAVVVSVEMGQAILLEAGLSFLGLGVPPPAPSWGLMLAEAKEDIFFASWAITLPGIALFLLVLATGLISEGFSRGR